MISTLVEWLEYLTSVLEDHGSVPTRVKLEYMYSTDVMIIQPRLTLKETLKKSDGRT